MQRYRSSINLHYDLPDARLLERYILTPSHAVVLRGLLDGITHEEGARAHLLIGPYGTGKSLLSTIACQWVSRSFTAEWRKTLLLQAQHIDTSLASLLRSSDQSEYTLLPVLINGKTGSLRKIVNQSVHRTLYQHGIELVTPNEARAILQAVDRWRSDYPIAYEAFLGHLSELQISEGQWREQIALYDDRLTAAFAAFYPRVTSGTPWMFVHDEWFIDELERIAEALATMGKGLFIVYDEFGRFLQSLGGADTLENMQDLQNLAEFVSRLRNVHLLVVGHKHIRQYAAVNRESIRGEFEKVEKRFRFYALENDSSTFLRLAQEAIADTNAECLERASQEGEHAAFIPAEVLQRFPLFSEYTAYQLEQSIIRHLYPLHPVAYMLLPHLSNIFGQNERTLFSFLSDNERYSLRDHVNRGDEIYYADGLFDFFHLEESDRTEIPSLQLYYAVEASLDDQRPVQRRIAKLLTLWSAARLTSKQPMTTAFAACALGISEAALQDELERMEMAKVVRMNSIRGLWELVDGSSLDLNAVIAERLETASLTDQEALTLLDRHLPNSYVMPYEYNDEKDMLRYADIRFTKMAELRALDQSRIPADDRVWLLVYEMEEEREVPAQCSAELAGLNALIAFPSFTMQGLRRLLTQIKIIEQLLLDPAFLARDARLKNELSYIKDELGESIRRFVSRYFTFEELEWYSGAERKLIKNMEALEQVVTERLRWKFHSTPRVANEAFNRNRISSVQRRALIDVIDRVIRQPSEPQLGIEGFGPNYLIYASTLKNNGYAVDGVGHVAVGPALVEVREALLLEIERYPVGRLSRLVDILREPPFGIRTAVVPLLFVALLRDRWEQLMFYAHDMLTTHLEGASVLELVELSDAYEYRYYEWTAEELDALQRLGQLFEFSEARSAGFLELANEMLRWLRGLPKFTQLTKRLTPAAIKFRDRMQAAEIDPYKHVRGLCANLEEAAIAKLELEQHLDRSKRELTDRIWSLTGHSTFQELGRTLAEYNGADALGKQSKLLTMSNWTDEADTLDRLIEHLIGVPYADWSDATEQLFLEQMRYEWELIHAGQRTDGAYAPAMLFIEETISLSKKAQTLYANVKNILKHAGRDIPPQELRGLLVKLLQEMDR